MYLTTSGQGKLGESPGPPPPRATQMSWRNPCSKGGAFYNYIQSWFPYKNNPC